MKVLFIGGTGTISSGISRRLLEQGHELFLLNRGNKNSKFDELKTENRPTYITVDINDLEAVKAAIDGLYFDCVADFIAFEKPQVERDYELFKGKTKQYIFISSASAYQTPLANPYITESTPLHNPYWEYSRNKAICEDYLNRLYREEGFPITIVRPSHTYGEDALPMGVHGNKGFFQVLKRMMDNKPVIIHGDGTSLWTVTHNRDFAVAFTGLIGNIHAIGDVFHITSDESLTWNQIHQIIADKLGVEFKPYYVPSDFLAKCGKQYDFYGSLLGDKSNSVIFDNSKVKSLVPEFNATTRFDQGAKEVIDYILTHKECQVEDKEFDSWCDKVISALDEAAEKVRTN